MPVQAGQGPFPLVFPGPAGFFVLLGASPAPPEANFSSNGRFQAKCLRMVALCTTHPKPDPPPRVRKTPESACPQRLAPLPSQRSVTFFEKKPVPQEASLQTTPTTPFACPINIAQFRTMHGLPSAIFLSRCKKKQQFKASSFKGFDQVFLDILP